MNAPDHEMILGLIGMSGSFAFCATVMYLSKLYLEKRKKVVSDRSASNGKVRSAIKKVMPIVAGGVIFLGAGIAIMALSQMMVPGMLMDISPAVHQAIAPEYYAYMSWAGAGAIMILIGACILGLCEVTESDGENTVAN